MGNNRIFIILFENRVKSYLYSLHLVKILILSVKFSLFYLHI